MHNATLDPRCASSVPPGSADAGLATYPIVGVGVDEVVERAELALGCLTPYCVESLGVELLIARLHGGAPGPAPGAGPGDLLF
jgi:hypothetical protein